MKVRFYENVDDSLLKFAVIVSKSFGKWVFCKHKERFTYEIPGGHREDGETILETAKRELYEETGAINYDIIPISVYSVTDNKGIETFGMLYYADIINFEEELHSEIEKIELFDNLPTKSTWTYPLLQSKLVEKFLESDIKSTFAVKAIIRSELDVLLLYKTDEESLNDSESNKWDLPGGRIYQNESLIEGLEREIKEETGLIILDINELCKKVIENKNGEKIKFVYYECVSRERNITLSGEHKNYSWKYIIDLMEDKTIPKWIKWLVV